MTKAHQKHTDNRVAALEFVEDYVVDKLSWQRLTMYLNGIGYQLDHVYGNHWNLVNRFDHANNQRVIIEKTW